MFCCFPDDFVILVLSSRDLLGNIFHFWGASSANPRKL